MKRKLGCKMLNMTIKWKVNRTKLNLDSYYTLYYFSLYIYFQIVQNVICHVALQCCGCALYLATGESLDEA